MVHSKPSILGSFELPWPNLEIQAAHGRPVLHDSSSHQAPNTGHRESLREFKAWRKVQNGEQIWNWKKASTSRWW